MPFHVERPDLSNEFGAVDLALGSDPQLFPLAGHIQSVFDLLPSLVDLASVHRRATRRETKKMLALPTFFGTEIRLQSLIYSLRIWAIQ